MTCWQSEVGSLKIGVLAAQGAFIEHIQAINRLKVDTIEVRLPRDLEGINGLIIPGGESTTISRLIIAYDLSNGIKEMAASGLAVWGTCAGMIMLAKNLVDGNGVQPLKLMDITVRRNAFGRQVDSFEMELPIPVLKDGPFHAVFIRAPLIEQVGREVEILASLEDGTVVAARQNNMVVTSFHPELTEDLRFHRYFLDIAANTVKPKY
jgi:pyridoxal 5'-phosphate synthase pdxT subunit